jgi:hypothetical protein
VRRMVYVAAGGLLAGCTVLLSGGQALADDTKSSASGDGILSGNALSIDVDVPVTVCGVLGGLLGGTGEGSCATLPLGVDTTSASGSGSGILTGNSCALDIDLPITVGGPAVPTPRSLPGPGLDLPGAPDAGSNAPPGIESQPTAGPVSAPSAPTAKAPTPEAAAPPEHRADQPAPPVARPARLPVTGTSVTTALPLGAGLLVLGTALCWMARRRRPVPRHAMSSAGRRLLG